MGLTWVVAEPGETVSGVKDRFTDINEYRIVTPALEVLDSLRSKSKKCNDKSDTQIIMDLHSEMPADLENRKSGYDAQGNWWDTYTGVNPTYYGPLYHKYLDTWIEDKNGLLSDIVECGSIAPFNGMRVAWLRAAWASVTQKPVVDGANSCPDPGSVSRLFLFLEGCNTAEDLVHKYGTVDNYIAVHGIQAPSYVISTRNGVQRTPALSTMTRVDSAGNYSSTFWETYMAAFPEKSLVAAFQASFEPSGWA